MPTRTLSDNSTWSNASAISPVEYVKEPLSVEVFRLVVEVIIALFGIIGNVLVCFVVTKKQKLHSIVNFHIRNLAIADLGVLLMNFPLAVIKEQHPTNWPLGEFFCRYIYPIGDVFHGVSVWSITAIAIDRYRAIVREIRRDKNRALKISRFIVLSLWVISFVIVSVPLFFVMEFIDLRPERNYVDCTPLWPGQADKNIPRQIYMLGIALFWYVIPLSVIIWTYIKIAQRLKQSSKFHKSIRRVAAKKRQHREKVNAKAKKLLTPVVVVFTVTMFPLNALRLAIIYWKDLQLDRHLWVYYNITVICVIVNSSVNCLIYALVSKDFRRNLFQQCCKRTSKENYEMPNSKSSPMTFSQTKNDKSSLKNTVL